MRVQLTGGDKERPFAQGATISAIKQKGSPMSLPHVPVSPALIPPDEHDPPGTHRRSRAGLTERVAGWSAGHRKTAVLGWLLLVAAVFITGQALGAKRLPNYDSGQSGKAERVLQQVAPSRDMPYSEAVLIQARAPGATFATDPAMRQAAAQVAAALAHLPKYASGARSPVSAGAGRWCPPMAAAPWSRSTSLAPSPAWTRRQPPISARSQPSRRSTRTW